MNLHDLDVLLLGDYACPCTHVREVEPLSKSEKWVAATGTLFLAAVVVWLSFHLAYGYWWHRDRQLRQAEACLRAGLPYVNCYEVLTK